MGRNLPPGVSVSDLPGNEPGPEPECFECSAYPSMEAMEDGYPLCEEHDTPENRAHYDEEIAARRERQAALEREQRAERDRPVPDEPLPQPLVPREVVEEEDEDSRTDGGEVEVNPPQGDRTDNPLTDREIRDLIRRAELLRYVPGTEEHAGNVMAVFETPDGDGIGLTFVADPSTYPDDLIGETVREERPFVRGSGTAHGKAFVLFEDRDAGTEKITIRNTQAVGVYEVDP